MATLLETASLVMVPSGYEDGTLGSLVPTNASGDFTFTRGSNLSATRVNEQGFIEKGYENLLLQSNSFDTTWGYNPAVVSVTGSQVGYDGTNDAWLLGSLNTSTSEISRSVSFNGVYNYSVYAKAGTANYLVLLEGLGQRVHFDLANGTIGAKAGTIDASIESLGNGWHRCSFSFSRSSATTARIYVADANNSLTSAIGSNIYIQDAQINQGLVAYPYIETTTAPEKGGILADRPRIDYSSGRASLLLEPERTNLIGDSEFINYALVNKWNNLNSVVITNNYGDSPEGFKNSTRVQFSRTNSSSQLYYVFSSEASAYTATAYFKGSGSLKFGFYDNVNDLTERIDLTNEWQRFSVTKTLAASGNTRFWIYPSGETDFEIYGAQVEQGYYPTSYIPTYGTTQTRLADLCVNSGDVNTFNSTEGVFYFEGNAFVSDPSAEGQIYIYNDSGSELISIRFNRISANNIFVGMAGTTGTSGFIQNNSVNLTNTFKLALKYSVGNWKLYVNGNLLGTTNATTFSANTLNSLNFSSNISTIPLEGNVGQVLYFPTALSDEACIELTTL